MNIQSPSDLPAWGKVTRHGPARGVYVQRGLDISTNIYRYMRADDFRRMMSSSEFYMSKVQRWTDPYEKWWCSKLFHEKSELKGVNAYGSCWTLRSNNEPFWRLYQDRCSHTDAKGNSLPAGDPPVRIKATISNIVSMLSREVDKVEGKAFIGNVYYCRTSEIETEGCRLASIAEQVARNAARGLHLKRYGFWYEKEIRVLWVDRNDNLESRTIAFNPVSLIEGVMIGPTLDIPAAKRVKAEVVGMGIPKDRVRRSLIYRIPRA